MMLMAPKPPLCHPPPDGYVPSESVSLPPIPRVMFSPFGILVSDGSSEGDKQVEIGFVVSIACAAFMSLCCIFGIAVMIWSAVQ